MTNISLFTRLCYGPSLNVIALMLSEATKTRAKDRFLNSTHLPEMGWALLRILKLGICIILVLWICVLVSNSPFLFPQNTYTNHLSLSLSQSLSLSAPGEISLLSLQMFWIKDFNL